VELSLSQLRLKGDRSAIPTNPADMLSDFVFSCVKILDVVLRTSALSYLWYIFVNCEFLCVLSFQVYKNICMKTLTKAVE
jgi:hypothetical protein